MQMTIKIPLIAICAIAGLIATVTLEPVAGSSHSDDLIPAWIKNNALWWAEGKISDNEYATALTWLAGQGIITIPESKPATNCTDLANDYLMTYAAILGISYARSETDENGITSSMKTEVITSMNRWGDNIAELNEKFQNNNCKPNAQTDLALVITDVYGTLTTKLNNQLTGNQNCILFCDSSGYEPSWAKRMGENQAQSKCLQVITDGSVGSKDWNWCGEFNGYLLDKLG